MKDVPCITLNRHAQDRLKRRHPWIFSNELSDPKRFAKLDPGSIVDVLDSQGEYVGTGFVNPKSLISVRILSRKRGESFGTDFFYSKMKQALEIRDALYGEKSPSAGTYRAVFGESDGLPGLVIDRFQGGWVVEPHAFGMSSRRNEIADAIVALSKDRYKEDATVYYRTDHRMAQLEGIEAASEVIRGKPSSDGTWAVEDGIRFQVDPLKGQKTGFFFDQRDNRAFFAKWAKEKRAELVLDVFCHAGAWGLRALKSGAKKAIFIDSSASALETVRKAAKEMGVLDRVECMEGDAMEMMKKLSTQSFDLVALDPPALVPNKKSLPQGAKAYRDLNREAARLVKLGGALSTSSCSYHMLEDRFEESVQRGLSDAQREGRVIHRGGMSADHPFLPGVEEGRYLKNLFVVL